MKYFFAGLLMSVLISTPFAMQAAGGATYSFDHSVYNVSSGHLFDVIIKVDPKGEMLDTIRTVVTYNPEIVQAQSVRLLGDFDRSSPGNYRDNIRGKTSWGAFTLGAPISKKESVVAITFLARKEGNSAIAISSDSHAISNGEELMSTDVFEKASFVVRDPESTQEGVSVFALESESHPSESNWFNSKEVSFSWTQLEGESPVLIFFYGFDQDPQGEATTLIEQDATSVNVSASEDGIYYIHLKGVQENGLETALVTRSVKIDTENPNPITLTAQDSKIIEGESVWFTFATTDEVSGIAEYQVAINESEFQTQTNPLEIEDLPAGTYFFRVAALDRAGNTSYGSTSVRVYSQDTQLARPEGLENDSEVALIIAKSKKGIEDLEKSFKKRFPVIPVVLGVLFIFAILYWVRARKK